MIVVLGSRLDTDVRALVKAWSAFDAALLSAEDLGRPGWRFRPDEPGAGSAVVDGQRVAVRDVRAVLTRLGAIDGEERPHILASERPYVAAESNAFLAAWLNALPCRVVNRPSPNSLCGPAWSVLHWRKAAARVGVAWADTKRMEINGDGERTGPAVLVCGGQVLFADGPAQAADALALAKAAGVALLNVRFFEGRVCGVSLVPALDNRVARDCLVSYLMGME